MDWGLQHEAAYAAREGYEPMPEQFSEHAKSTVLDAMRQGRPRLFQATVSLGELYGVIDLLRRVPGPSLFGEYHYEVGDVKSSGRAKAEQVMQVLLYTYILEGLQGTRAEHGFLVLADGTEWRFRTADYWDYFLSVLEHAQRVLIGEQQTEPVQTHACALCRWHPTCHAQLRATGDLSLVPGVTQGRRSALRRAGIETEEALRATAPERRVPGLPSAHLRRLIRQAQARSEGRPLPLIPGRQPVNDKLYLSLLTDFSRNNAVFALAAHQVGRQEERQVWFAQTPEAIAALAEQAGAWLLSRRHVPWVLWDRWGVRALERTFGHLPGLPVLEDLSRTLWDHWALPVDSYHLLEVARSLQLGEPPHSAAPAALRYHLYLAQQDRAVRADLEEQAQWEVGVMANLDGWMQGPGMESP